MTNWLRGIRYPALPYSDATWERDLITYDGPVLALYRGSGGEPILYYWCDGEGSLNRWIVLEISEEQLRAFEEHRVFLSEVIRHPRNRILFLVDIGPTGSIESVTALIPELLPSEYLPDLMAEIKAGDVVNPNIGFQSVWQISLSPTIPIARDVHTHGLNQKWLDAIGGTAFFSSPAGQQRATIPGRHTLDTGVSFPRSAVPAFSPLA